MTLEDLSGLDIEVNVKNETKDAEDKALRLRKRLEAIAATIETAESSQRPTEVEPDELTKQELKDQGLEPTLIVSLDHVFGKKDGHIVLLEVL